MSAVVDLFVTRNPLLAHGPRSHRTGIALPSDRIAPGSTRSRGASPDAPRLHLGRAHW